MTADESNGIISSALISNLRVRKICVCGRVRASTTEKSEEWNEFNLADEAALHLLT